MPGETVMLLPVPTSVPPQEALYQLKTAPVPNVPPLTVKVVLPPAQIVLVPLIAVGAVDKVFTVTVELTVEVQPEAFVTVTVYVVVETGLRVFVEPVPNPALQA